MIPGVDNGLVHIQIHVFMHMQVVCCVYNVFGKSCFELHFGCTFDVNKVMESVIIFGIAVAQKHIHMKKHKIYSVGC